MTEDDKDTGPPDEIDPAIRRAIDATQGPGKGPDIDVEWQAMASRIAGAHSRRLGPAGMRAARMRAARPPTFQVGLWAAVAAIIFAIATMARAPHPGQAGWHEYTTIAGQRSKVTLADGTEFTLAPASRLRVPLDYASGDRGVTLDGEAFFAVVHNAAHPFSVRARNAIATDIGTQFDVRSYPDGATRVAVVEGRVGIQSVGAAFRPPVVTRTEPLIAGDIATVSDTVVAITRGADGAAMTAWTHGELLFAQTPMRDVFATVGRWYDLDLRVSDPSMWAEPFTGSFSTESVDQVIGTFALILHARAERSGHVVTFVRATHQ